MTRSHAIWTFLAAVNLFLAVCGAAHLPLLDDSQPASQELHLYRNLSGSEGSFGFFAPGVAGERRLECVLNDGAGRTWTEGLDMNHFGPEVSVRVLPLLLSFSDDDLRGPMAASVAAEMFGRFPEAQQVTVRINVCDLPSMPDYQAGSRPRWRLWYEATFSRDEPKSAEERK